jgi:hypothetical protein
MGNGGDSCAGVPENQWRCVFSDVLGLSVSQTCRSGAWVNYNTNPSDCAACVCSYSAACAR